MLFENAGGKIKGLAWVSFWSGVAVSIIFCVILFAIDLTLSWIGILIIICGPLISLILSLFTYGFGEIVENTTEIRKNTKATQIRENTKAADTYELPTL